MRESNFLNHKVNKNKETKQVEKDSVKAKSEKSKIDLNGELSDQEIKDLFKKIKETSDLIKEKFHKNKVSMYRNIERKVLIRPNFDSSSEMNELELRLNCNFIENEGKWFLRKGNLLTSLNDESLLSIDKKTEQIEVLKSEDLVDNFIELYSDRRISLSSLKSGESREAIHYYEASFGLVEDKNIFLDKSLVYELNPGDVICLINDKYSVLTMEEFLEKYCPHHFDPNSKKAFNILNKFKKTENISKDDFNELIAEFNKIKIKPYMEISEGKISSTENLRNDFRGAMEVARKLSQEISMKINSINFEEKMKQAEEYLHELIEDEGLTKRQKDHRISCVMAKLLPKTNNHQHLKGSVPQEILLKIAEEKGFSVEQIDKMKKVYTEGKNGFDTLSEFNAAYSVISKVIKTKEDYSKSIEGLLESAVKNGQLTVEIRCSIMSQKNEDGSPLDPEEAIENISKTIDKFSSKNEGEMPACGVVFLSNRSRERDPELVYKTALLAVETANKHPKKKWGFDVAGPEDKGYSAIFFTKSFKVINEYNESLTEEDKRMGKQTIGITVHSGETPTYDLGKPGFGSVEEALSLNVDRIGHGVQAISQKETLDRLKKSKCVVEICGVCNVMSIPINTEGMASHPVDELLNEGVDVTICTDNDAICGTNIDLEWILFFLTGHKNLMNWKSAKKIARKGVESSFVNSNDKNKALDLFDERVERITNMVFRILDQGDYFGEVRAS